MNSTTSYAPSTITCAKPGCDTVTTLAESGYIEGCGQVCLDCFGGPALPWLDDIDPPF